MTPDSQVLLRPKTSADREAVLRELFRQMFDRERREDDDARAIYRHMAQRCSR